MADIYFVQGKYPQAVESYEKHLEFYPTKKTDYVLYQIGLSYKKQLPYRSDYDLNFSNPALKAFDRLLNLKKTSIYREKAKKEKQEILNKKASKELEAILFYIKQGWNKAAFKRVQYFIKNYPHSPLMPKTLLEGFFLAKLLNEEAEKFKKDLIENHPDSQEAKTIHKSGTRDSSLSRWRQKLL